MLLFGSRQDCLAAESIDDPVGSIIFIHSRFDTDYNIDVEMKNVTDAVKSGLPDAELIKRLIVLSNKCEYRGPDSLAEDCLRAIRLLYIDLPLWQQQELAGPIIDTQVRRGSSAVPTHDLLLNTVAQTINVDWPNVEELALKLGGTEALYFQVDSAQEWLMSKRASELLDAVHSKNKYAAQPYEQYADRLSNRGEYEAAAHYYQRALASNLMPNAFLIVKLARMYGELGDHKKESQLVSTNPNGCKGNLNQADALIECLLLDGLFEEALAVAKVASLELIWVELPTTATFASGCSIVDRYMFPASRIRKWGSQCRAAGNPELEFRLYESCLSAAKQVGFGQTRAYEAVLAHAAVAHAENGDKKGATNLYVQASELYKKFENPAPDMMLDWAKRLIDGLK
jgi:tetratricopeptide (TPR) repeat protein